MNSLNDSQMDQSGTSAFAIERKGEIGETLREMDAMLTNNNAILGYINDTDVTLGRNDKTLTNSDENFYKRTTGKIGDALEEIGVTLKEIDPTLKEIVDGSEETRENFVEHDKTTSHNAITVNNRTLGHTQGLPAGPPEAKTTAKSFASVNLQRHLHLRERCAALNADPWYRMDYMQMSRFLDVCVSPKCGSSSWRRLLPQLSSKWSAGQQRVSIVSVRHPLTRLVSAYRDKFLNGAPISAYDSTWKAATKSGQPWETRWALFWLPALVSRGDVKPSLWLSKDRFDSVRNVSNPCKLSLLFDAGNLEEALRPYQEDVGRYKERFYNASFSFPDFLRHVLWSRDHGILDRHWTPQTCICNPCGEKYDYIIHMENIERETRHVFDDIGIDPGVNIGNFHVTKGALRVSDEDYFRDVANDTMVEILRLFSQDFDLFGYV
ncbi:uncharacterized protein LOC122260443 [Penaeus japonicus]|uniref:uncharacterized protein LOC122260443 n=1 Tax=Penaeus japonicus TaxID=27405 RepID=UPI001C711979|nr:uncharacterized protein LOC122260443 [Penaeus japonicus]